MFALFITDLKLYQNYPAIETDNPNEPSEREETACKIMYKPYKKGPRTAKML
jgi:GR25 family glycosyltransferase involved in LPS biosynthesis